MSEVTITQEQADAKVFPYESLRACEAAFVDMRIPKHEGKKNEFFWKNEYIIDNISRIWAQKI